MQSINDKITEIFPQDCAIVFLEAHPDDETFLSGGLIYQLQNMGYQIYVIYCAAAADEKLAGTVGRQQEAVRALRCLAPDRICFLPYFDSCFENVDTLVSVKLTEAVRCCTDLFTRISRPIVLVSYDENGGYGHKDHIAVHKLGLKLRRTNTQIRQLYEVTINRSLFNTWIADHTHKEKSYLPQTQYWAENYGTSAEEIDYSFTLSPELTELKRRHLSGYASQMSAKEFPLILSDEDFTELFGTEYLKK